MSATHRLPLQNGKDGFFSSHCTYFHPFNRVCVYVHKQFNDFFYRLFEVVETLGRVHLVTEWVRGGELYHRITQGGPLPELQAALLYRQLLLAVKHMVSRNVFLSFPLHQNKKFKLIQKSKLKHIFTTNYLVCYLFFFLFL